MQVAPLEAQVLGAGALHVVPEQQPLGQVAPLQPLQAPPVQTCAPGQGWQRAPPLPQAATELPVRQLLPEQQPVGQEVESQTHAPLEQRCPGPQGALGPHWHVPEAVHWFETEGSQVAQVAPAVPQRESERT